MAYTALCAFQDLSSRPAPALLPQRCLPATPGAGNQHNNSSSVVEMKGMKFASSGGDEKAAAFGDALAESVLDEPDAEEQDVGGDDGEGGAGAGEDAANEKEEEEEEAPFDENLRPFCGSSLARSARSPAALSPATPGSMRFDALPSELPAGVTRPYAGWCHPGLSTSICRP